MGFTWGLPGAQVNPTTEFLTAQNPPGERVAGSEAGERVS
jgi:hypothetical protein